MSKTVKCKFCGKAVDSEATHCPHCGEAIARVNKKKRMAIWLGAIALLAVVAFVVYNMLSSSKADMFAGTSLTEEDSWDIICLYRDTNNPDSLEGALLNYQNNFPRGEHALAVQTLKERLQKEAREWNNVENNGSKKELLERYMSEYKKEGFFYLRAVDKLDSITFFEQQELNTVDAYQLYLDKYPDGRYVDQAKANLEKLDVVPLTDAEENGVKDVINNHFDALSNNDSIKARTTIAKNISSYLGKKPCTPGDVSEYIRHMYEVPDRQIRFETSDFVIKKISIIEDGDPIFNVTFKVYEEMNKPSKYRETA